MGASIEIRDVAANGFTFRTRVADGGGEPVLLLHGFPETSHMWTDLMPQLADAGYRCIAPDQRGYSPGARPEPVEAYAYGPLASDVFAIADAFGAGRFHLVGHDWGALVGWAVVCETQRDRVASFTSMSIPHIIAFARATYEDPGGDLYRGILQMLLTEGTFEGLIASNADAFRATWTHSPAEQVDEYISVLSQPGAMRAAANWYRACDGHKTALAPDAIFGAVTTPTLLIWGKNDPYVRRMSVELAPQYMAGKYRVAELDAGHWLAQEAPDAVAAEVLSHLRGHAI